MDEKPVEQNLTRDEVFRRLTKNIETILQLSRAEEENRRLDIKNDTDIFSDLGIDSVEVMDLLVSLETEFQTSIDPAGASTKRKVGEMADFLWNKLSGQV